MHRCYTLQYNGKLRGTPFLHKPSAALARCMPLTSDNDFEVFARLPNSQAPILINFIEHYQILDALVLHANEIWPNELTILVRLSMPGGMRLPKSLLASNVLLMQDVQPEIEKLSGCVSHLLVIDDDFIRYQLEQGNNDMTVQLFSTQADQDGNFALFLSELTQFNIGER